MGKSGLIDHARRVNSVLGGRRAGLVPRMDEYVERSWIRCANDYHLDPLNPGKTRVLQRQHVLERTDAAGELLRIATEESRNVYSQTRGSGYVIVVTDSDGVILSWIGDPTLDEELARGGLRTGAVWDERRKGTNGMGTCLAEGKPVTIHNQDHFFGAHGGLTCSGVPIRNTSGKVAAILDASSLNAAGDKTGQIYTSALLQMSANRIEHCFFLKSYARETILRLNRRADLIGTIDDALIALDPVGRVLAVNDVALGQLQVASRRLLVGRGIEEVLGVGLERLLAAYHDSGSIPVKVHANASGAVFFAGAREPAHKTGGTSPPAGGKLVLGDVPAPTLDDIAGADPTMKANVARARSLINKAVPVLLAGETGTGKSAFARALHNESDRRDRSFVSIDCATISRQQLEDEGPGSWAAANGTPRKKGGSGAGTLFLDEVAEMDEDVQCGFLKILEDLVDGSSCDGEEGPRIISATRKHLVELVEQGRFRKDLYYRLYGLQLTLVPLAKRADKEQMIRGILEQENKGLKPVRLSDDALGKLLSHAWEGNFRELHLVLRTALAITDTDEIRVEHLPENIEAGNDAAHDTPTFPGGESTEKDLLMAALQRNRWNVSKTAASLGVSRNTLYRKMKRFCIPKKTD